METKTDSRAPGMPEEGQNGEAKVAQGNIDARTLRDMLERSQQVTVVDVRKGKDYAEGAIPGSVNFDAYDALHAGDEGHGGARVAGGCASGHRVQSRTLQRGGRRAVAEAGTRGILLRGRKGGLEVSLTRPLHKNPALHRTEYRPTSENATSTHSGE